MRTINAELKDFRNAVEAIWLRGKYKTSTVSKTGVVSNTAVAIITNQRLELLNGNDKSAVSASISLSNDDGNDEEFLFIFDIEKAMKYIKNIKTQQLTLTIDDSFFTIKSDKTSVRLPRLLEHSNMNLISMIRTFNVKPNEPIIFGKTQLECSLVIDGDELSNAIKFCNLVGTATFCMDYKEGKDTINISSTNFHRTELVNRTVQLLSTSTKDMTVEFSAPIDKFCISGPMIIYTGDNKPLILTAPFRKMIIAPYIRVN
tara:strand:- start:11319 stop:12095 length:777 start_codon:yes stop_codon:yes gene_type:complete